MAKYSFYTSPHREHPTVIILNQKHHGRYPAMLFRTLIAGVKPYRHNLLNYSVYKTQALPVPAELNQMVDYVWERMYDVSKR